MQAQGHVKHLPSSCCFRGGGDCLDTVFWAFSVASLGKLTALFHKPRCICGEQLRDREGERIKWEGKEREERKTVVWASPKLPMDRPLWLFAGVLG